MICVGVSVNDNVRYDLRYIIDSHIYNIQGVFFTGTPPKSSKSTKKLI